MWQLCDACVGRARSTRFGDELHLELRPAFREVPCIHGFKSHNSISDYSLWRGDTFAAYFRAMQSKYEPLSFEVQPKCTDALPCSSINPTAVSALILVIEKYIGDHWKNETLPPFIRATYRSNDEHTNTQAVSWFECERLGKCHFEQPSITLRTWITFFPMTTELLFKHSLGCSMFLGVKASSATIETISPGQVEWALTPFTFWLDKHNGRNILTDWYVLSSLSLSMAHDLLYVCMCSCSPNVAPWGSRCPQQTSDYRPS